MDTHKRARKNDTVDATQNALTHHTNEKEVQKDRETKRQDQRRKIHQRLELALATKVKTGKAQTLTKTRTATYLSRTILRKKWAQQRLKRKIGSTTWKEAQTMLQKRWRHAAEIRCWNKTHKTMKWRLALRIATSPSERDGWWKLQSETPNSAQNTGPTERLGDQEKDGKMTSTNASNSFEDETENFTESSSQINKTWFNTAKDRGRWTLLEEKDTMTSEERQENDARMRMRRIVKADQRDTSTEWDWATKK